MTDDMVSRVENNPRYKELVSKRTAYGWVLTALMMIVYFGYILLVAFDKEFLARKLGVGVTSIGIPMGVGVILFTIVITAFYVWRANGEFDAMTDQIVKETK